MPNFREMFGGRKRGSAPKSPDEERARLLDPYRTPEGCKNKKGYQACCAGISADIKKSDEYYDRALANCAEKYCN